MPRALRVDYATAPVEKAETLADGSRADGSRELPAYIARCGVQVYQYTDGTQVREYRPPEEVFAEASLESWDDLAVVNGHPGAPVTPDNWAALAKGHVDGPSKDGDFVYADLIVKDRATITAIDSGELVELSCGYFATIDPTPGTTPAGEPYDQIQRNIVGNHVALGPKGWGRAGADVKLYAGDGAGEVRDGTAFSRFDSTGYHTGMPEITPTAPAAPANPTLAERLAPVTVPVADFERVKAELDALKASIAQTATTAALDSRVALRVAAIKFDSKIDTSKSDREIMLAVILASDKDFKADGKSDDYIRARFDFALQAAPRVDAASQPNTSAIVSMAGPPQIAGAPQVRDDGNSAVDARQKMIARNSTAWEKK